MKWLRILAALWVTVGAGLPASSLADDTEIYSRQVNTITEEVRPNILFMLDNSGSMLWPMRDEETGADTGANRIDILKDALLEMLDQVNNVNVGIGRFSSRSGDVNTPILYPVAYIDAEVEDNGDGLAGHIYASYPIAQASDDAEEATSSGKMSLSDETLDITTLDAANTTTIKIENSLDDVLQLESGTVWDGVPVTEHLRLGGTSIAGLRFANIPLPKGVTIKSAQITFSPRYSNAQASDLTMKVQGVNQAQMDAFPLTTNGVSSLPKTTANIDWIISEPWKDDATYNSPDLSTIVEEIISKPDWQVGNALAFIFQPVDGDNRRVFGFDEDSTKAPELRLVYEVPAGLTYEVLHEQRISLEGNDAFEFRPANPSGSFTIYDNTQAGTTWTDQIRLGTAFCLGNKPKGNSCRGEALVGLRFADLPIPKNATITEAKIEMTYRDVATTKMPTDPLSLKIYAEDNANANLFEVGNSTLKDTNSDIVNSNLSARTKTSNSVMWANLPNEVDNQVITSPDLTALVQGLVNKSDWEKSNNAIAFLLERDQSVPWKEMSGQRGVHYIGLSTTNDTSNDPTKAAKLIVKWTGVAEASQPVEQKVGLRFQYVDIPQGAKVTDAKLVFTSALSQSDASTVVIQGETGSSEEFISEDGNLSARTLTTNKADWTMNAWTEDNAYTSPDLTDIVQEIVNSANWCGGKGGMTFIISPKTGAPMRNAQAFEFSKSNAPTLKVAYNINEINGTGCTVSTYSGRIVGTDDDVEETVIRDGAADGTMFTDSVTLEMTVTGANARATQRLVGLRFQDIPIPKGTKATKAVIEFTADSATAGDGTLTIRGEKSPNAIRFSGSTKELSNRPKTSASVTWELNDQNEWVKDQTFQTIDISNIINEITSQGGWEAYNDIVLFISGDEGLREAKSFDRSPAEAPVLRITVDGLLGDGTAGNTVRTHLKKAVRDMFVPSYSSTAIVDALHEAYLYYSGGEVNGGSNRLNNLHYRISHPASHTGTSLIPEGCDINLDPYSEACAKEKIAEAHADYISPIISGCQANHVVLLTDGQPTKNTVAGRIGSEIDGGCANGYPDGAPYLDRNTKDGSTNQDHVCGPELAKRMATEDMSDLEGFQNVMTHTVGFQLGSAWLTNAVGTKGSLILDSEGNPQVDVDVTAQNEQTTRYMKYISGMGQGDFYPASSATQLLDAFKSIIAKAMTSSTSYAAPSVSVSAFNRLFHRNEVYFSLFKPDFKQRWNGNVKKYLICDGSASANNCTIGDIIDATGNSAVANRYISPDAKSFWSDVTDGEKVQEGGAGERGQKDLTYRLGESNSRKIFTYLGNSNLTDESNEIRTNNAALTSQIADTSLIEWIRGKDVDDENQDGIYDEMRWIYADPLHSSPVVMSYDASDNKTFLFVGTNDGLIRMINAKTGREEWAFLVPELFDIQADLRLNEKGARIYGVDASPTIWFNEPSGSGTDGVVDSGDTVKLFFGMRRGGRNLYGLDVKDPQAPKLDWTIKGGVDSDFDKLGQTWSAARPVVVNHEGKKKVVLMFGGGYDETQDVEYSTSNIGNAVYMIDPNDGSILWSASNSGADLNLPDMKYAIPSDLAFMDVDGDGAMDRIYFGDMGGQVWRIDIGGIGGDYQGTGGVLGKFGSDAEAEQRRFFYPPEVVRVTDTIYSAEDQYDLVLLTSGNRTNPLGVKVNDDQFYALRDYSLGALPDINDDGIADEKNGDADTTFHTSVVSDLVDLTDNILQAGSAEERTAVIDELQANHGWYINLTAEAGEKGLASPVVLNGVVFFTTYSPPDTSLDTACSTGGDGNSRLYALNIFTAGSAFNFDGEGTTDDLKTTDRSQMLREGITSDIVPMFINNLKDGTGEVRLLSNDLSLLGQDPVANIDLIPTFWMQEK